MRRRVCMQLILYHYTTRHVCPFFTCCYPTSNCCELFVTLANKMVDAEWCTHADGVTSPIQAGRYLILMPSFRSHSMLC